MAKIEVGDKVKLGTIVYLTETAATRHRSGCRSSKTSTTSCGTRSSRRRSMTEGLQIGRVQFAPVQASMARPFIFLHGEKAGAPDEGRSRHVEGWF